MAQLYLSKGTYPVTADDILDTLNGGVSANGNLKWKSNTSFYGEFDHANTANQVYSLPNASGVIPLISNTQTWSAVQTFNAETIFGAAITVKILRTSSNINPLTSAHYYIISTNTSGTHTLRLPTAASAPGRVYEFYKEQSGGQTLILPASGSGDTFDGAGSVTLASQYDYLRIVSNGVGVWMISH